MARASRPDIKQATSSDSWYSVPAEEVTARIGVDPAVGLSSQEAAELLSEDGPNALPAEAQVPGWRRVLQQYRTYMQMILLAAPIVSLAGQHGGTGGLLPLVTGPNARAGSRP